MQTPELESAGKNLDLSALNPEAGHHAMPSDPDVIAAALRAGAKAWASFPYLARRFGERGMRFTRSDSCWLATLADLEQTQAEDQALWLWRVLSFRGIPSVILETHLDLLSDELGHLPKHSGHEKLRLAADVLRAQRARVMEGDLFVRLSEELEGSLRSLGLPPRSGNVLLSAFADEICGISGAREKTQSWIESVLAPEEAAQFRQAAARVFRKALEARS